MKRGIALAASLLLLVASLGFAGGSGETDDGDPMTGTITLYTSETLTDAQALADEFQQLNPGARVEIFRLGTTELVARLMTELEAGETPADVVWFADMALFEQLAEDGDLLKIEPPEAANIPENYVYFDGMAYEVRLIFQVIAYNTNLVQKDVSSWFDLADPEYKGRVGSASPFVSGATVTQIASVVETPGLGWELYEQMAANDAVVTGGNGGIAEGIALGEYAIGLTIDFMARTQMEQGAPVDYVYQEEGAVYVPTPAGVMAGTDKPELAEAFVNYLMSVPGQKTLQASGYMPVNQNVELPAGLPSAAEIPVLSTDWQFLANNREMLLDRFAEIFGID
jgi:iron(III) transport system substrate-binding protein